ncbi:MAG: alpha-mannosidase, partial [Spirochaetes bacterium]|nr:alpha-mannosidase [Spirochaetota bacterium]
MSFRKEIYLVPYAHLDTQWRWEYPTTIKKYIRRTLEENLRLFEEYPGHRFNFTGTIRYSMMKEYYPELFERVRKLVAEGRWHLAGTCMDETDALVPSVESMIRNVLYGDRWQRREFDRSSRDYMIPDCFGFPANMPTVLAHCGILGFSSQKLAWNSAAGIPFDLGIWLGPDGSGLVSALNPCDYVSRVNAPVQSDRKRVSRLRSQGEKTGIWKSFQYYGVGDIGGAPTEKSVRTALGSIGKTAGEEDGVIVRQGSADDFFSGITADEKKAMERYEGDLLLINHSAGSLTSATIMKRWNRRNEQLAAAAEAAALAALKHAGLPYPAQKIESAWARVIGSQMHDILPGTCTPTAYEYSQNDEVVALKTWTAVLEDTAEAMAPLTAGDGDILLFNPLAEPREDAVSVALRGRDDAATGSVVLVSADGTEYPGQARLERDGSSVVTFAPRQAPFGWSRYSLSAAGSGAPARAPASVLVARRDGEFTLENEHLRVIVSPRGAVRSIVSKALAKEVLGKPLAYELQKEKPALYPAWNMDWRDRKKKPAFRIEDGGEVSVLEEGSERCSLRVRIQHNKSVLIKDISLDRNSDTVEFTERIEWRESGCSLKLAVSTAMDDTTVTYNWETSRIERGLNHSTCFEMPSRLWVEMRDPEWGVSLVEDSKYGFDHPAADTLRMTLIYTPATRALNGFRDQSSQDWGRHTVRYAIHAHRNGWNGTDRLARRFNQPTRAFCISDEAPDRPAGRLAPGQPSLFELSSEQIGVLAAKK